MSYDLFFLKRQASNAISPEVITQYFRGRAHYTLQDQQFWYQNEDTGVYFSFDLTSGGEQEKESPEGEPEAATADGLEPVGLSFNINYFRPHFFGLEAEGELSALTSRFSLRVDDPQNEGMGRGDYSREGFLRGWNAGNVFGHQAYLRQIIEGDQAVTSPRFDALPTATLEQMWRWNLHRQPLQKSLGDDVFVPGVHLVRHEGRPKTFVVWGDAIPEAIPGVDLLIVVRDKLAPGRLFFKKKDTCLVPFAAVHPLLHLAQRVDGTVPYHLFSYREPPPEVIDFFRSRQPTSEKLEGLSYDSVLTKETLDRAKAGAGGSGGA